MIVCLNFVLNIKAHKNTTRIKLLIWYNFQIQKSYWNTRSLLKPFNSLRSSTFHLIPQHQQADFHNFQQTSLNFPLVRPKKTENPYDLSRPWLGTTRLNDKIVPDIVLNASWVIFRWYLSNGSSQTQGVLAGHGEVQLKIILRFYKIAPDTCWPAVSAIFDFLKNYFE